MLFTKLLNTLWKQEPVYEKNHKMQNSEESSRKNNFIFHLYDTLKNIWVFFNKSLWSDSNDFAKLLQDRLDISLVKEKDITLAIIWIINVESVYIISFILKCNFIC